MSYTVVYTDHTFDDLSIEREVFEDADVELVDGEAVPDVRNHFPNADALAVMFDDITDTDVELLTDCTVVTRIGSGVDNFDVDALTRADIPLANVPEYCTPEVAEHTLALLFALERQIVTYDRAVRGGRWDASDGRSMRRLEGRTLGIVSFGKIGRAVARRAEALGLEISVFDPHADPVAIREAGYEPVTELHELLRRADVVTIHAPLTPETEGLFGRREFASMKDSAVLINAARGDIVDQSALVEALDSGEIAGAGLDVLCREPPASDDPLLDMDRVVLTPHAAWYSAESEGVLRRAAARNVLTALEGEGPVHLVNPSVRDRS